MINKQIMSTGVTAAVLCGIILMAFVCSGEATSDYAQPETIKTRIGDLSFTHDFAKEKYVIERPVKKFIKNVEFE